MSKLEKIRKLSKEILNEIPETETVEIYTLIDSCENSKNISYGQLLGLSDELWPRDYNDNKMDFHFMIYLGDFPELKKKFPDYQALVFFSEDEDSWMDEMDKTGEFKIQDNKVIFLDSQEYEKCSINGDFKKAVSFTVPTIAFGDPDKEYFDIERDAPELAKPLKGKLQDLHTVIYQLPIRIGGNPIWLQENEGATGFIMQFDEEFVSMNMGDSGVMYLYEANGFWQCY